MTVDEQNVLTELVNLANGLDSRGDGLAVEICQAAFQEIKRLRAQLASIGEHGIVLPLLSPEEIARLEAEDAKAAPKSTLLPWRKGGAQEGQRPIDGIEIVCLVRYVTVNGTVEWVANLGRYFEDSGENCLGVWTDRDEDLDWYDVIWWLPVADLTATLPGAAPSPEAAAVARDIAAMEAMRERAVYAIPIGRLPNVRWLARMPNGHDLPPKYLPLGPCNYGDPADAILRAAEAEKGGGGT
jgi:hypothetical protein